MDKKHNLNRTLYVLAALNPDIALLQEVDCRRPATSLCRQAVFLAEALEMNYVYGPVNKYALGSYGNAILSRYPIINHKNHKLISKDNQRCCLEAEIRTPFTELRVFNLHLGLNSTERYSDLKEIVLPLIKRAKMPAVLGGDFNTTPESPEISLVNEHLRDSFFANTGDCKFTFPADQPKARIDYIFINGELELNDCRIIYPTLASDHLPLQCKTKIKQK